MSRTDGDGAGLSPADSAAWRTWVERFEDAWQAGQRPTIDEYLPDGGMRRVVLIHLVNVDLERRLKAGEAVRVETYLGRHPELADDSAVVLGLVAAEYILRRRAEPGLRTEEYARRFPALAAQLPSRLAARPSGPSTVPGPRVEEALPPPQAEGGGPGATGEGAGATGSR